MSTTATTVRIAIEIERRGLLKRGAAAYDVSINGGLTEVYGMTSPAEAKERVATILTEALSERDWEPVILTHLGHQILVCRNLTRWAYRPIEDNGQLSGTYIEHFDKRSALSSARMHLAQRTYDPTLNNEAEAGAILANDAERREFARHCEFHRAYLTAKAAGHDNNMAWRIATNDPTLVREVPA